MNWNAINALSTFGIFVITLLSPIIPDKNILFIIYGIFLILLFLLIYHKLFRLIKKNQGNAIYKVEWGIKRWIENPATFKKLGHTYDDVDVVSDFEFNLHPSGKSIKLSKRYS